MSHRWKNYSNSWSHSSVRTFRTWPSFFFKNIDFFSNLCEYWSIFLFFKVNKNGLEIHVPTMNEWVEEGWEFSHPSLHLRQGWGGDVGSEDICKQIWRNYYLNIHFKLHCYIYTEMFRPVPRVIIRRQFHYNSMSFFITNFG